MNLNNMSERTVWLTETVPCKIGQQYKPFGMAVSEHINGVSPENVSIWKGIHVDKHGNQCGTGDSLKCDGGMVPT